MLEDRKIEMGSKDGIQVIFLSLYFLLLIFFIFLNSVSEVNEEKAEKVIESVKNTFTEQSYLIFPPGKNISGDIDGNSEEIIFGKLKHITPLFFKDTKVSFLAKDNTIFIEMTYQENLSEKMVLYGILTEHILKSASIKKGIDSRLTLKTILYDKNKEALLIEKEIKQLALLKTAFSFKDLKNMKHSIAMSESKDQKIEWAISFNN